MASAALPHLGKRALVLGGTSGIGLATAKLLVEGGAEVVSFGRSEDKIAAAVAALASGSAGSAGAGNAGAAGKFSAAQLDVLDRDAMSAAFAAHAGFDYLVCAATGGARAIGPFMEMDLDGFQGSFAKLWGYANAARLGIGHMAPDGSVVLVSGSPARRCKAGQISLSCVGGAVENMVRALAPEIAPRRINAVSPGIIDTPMFAGLGERKDAVLAGNTAGNPIARPGTADEVARGIVFALTNAFVTGSTIDVDGGWIVAAPKI
jgi:NAD(P)-dependent dehydrogenase (short-subunit alcohol dehydrogenase family)